MGIRGSILYVHKRNEHIVPTLVLFLSISGPRDEIERKQVGACVIPKADAKFWASDHSINKSYIKGIQCSFRFWTYNILPPILSSLHISFMCSQSISTLIKLTKKVSTFNNAQSILLDSYVLLDLYSNRDGFQFVFNHVNVLVLAHALPTRISPRIASPIVTF